MEKSFADNSIFSLEVVTKYSSSLRFRGGKEEGKNNLVCYMRKCVDVEHFLLLLLLNSLKSVENQGFQLGKDSSLPLPRCS